MDVCSSTIISARLLFCTRNQHVAEFEFTVGVLKCNLVFSFSVKEKLTADPESEIATTSLRVSLLCPVNIPPH